jgi:hypothetical protein
LVLLSFATQKYFKRRACFQNQNPGDKVYLQPEEGEASGGESGEASGGESDAAESDSDDEATVTEEESQEFAEQQRTPKAAAKTKSAPLPATAEEPEDDDFQESPKKKAKMVKASESGTRASASKKTSAATKHSKAAAAAHQGHANCANCDAAHVPRLGLCPTCRQLFCMDRVEALDAARSSSSSSKAQPRVRCPVCTSRSDLLPQ